MVEYVVSSNPYLENTLDLTHFFISSFGRLDGVSSFLRSGLAQYVDAWDVVSSDRRDFIGPDSDCLSVGNKRISTNGQNKTSENNSLRIPRFAGYN